MTEAEADLPTPPAVLQTIMIARFRCGDDVGAVEVAAIAAPLMHPRLAASTLCVTSPYEQMTEEEPRQEITSLERKMLPAHPVSGQDLTLNGREIE